MLIYFIIITYSFNNSKFKFRLVFLILEYLISKSNFRGINLNNLQGGNYNNNNYNSNYNNKYNQASSLGYNSIGNNVGNNGFNSGNNLSYNFQGIGNNGVNGIGGLGGLGGDIGGLGGLGGNIQGFGGKQLSSDVTVTTNLSSEYLVSKGKVLKESISVSTNYNILEINFSGNSDFLLTPEFNNDSNKVEIDYEILNSSTYIKENIPNNEIPLQGNDGNLSNNFNLQKLGLGLDQNQMNNIKSKVLKVMFDCYETSMSEFTIDIKVNRDDRLQFKIAKDCDYGIFLRIYHLLRFIFKTSLVLLIILIIVSAYLMYQNGNISILLEFYNKSRNIFTKEKEENYNNEESEPKITSDSLFVSKQNKFKMLQVDNELVNPKFYDNPGLIVSKRVKFDYDNYGSCTN